MKREYSDAVMELVDLKHFIYANGGWTNTSDHQKEEITETVTEEGTRIDPTTPPSGDLIGGE